MKQSHSARRSLAFGFFVALSFMQMGCNNSERAFLDLPGSSGNPSTVSPPTTTLPQNSVGFDSKGVVRTGFAPTGKTTADFGNSIAKQGDGKILVAGTASGDVDQMVVVRYNADGTLDTSFNSTGKVMTYFGANSGANAMTLQSDGKILVAGYSEASGWNDFALVRYNSDGSLDTSFNSTGKVFTDFGPGAADNSTAIAVQSDGKILVAGYSDASGNDNFAVARYNADGSLDTSFNSTGKVLTDIGSGSGDRAYGIAVQSDGKILVAGNSSASGTDDFAVVRYNANGTVDTSFGTSGKVLTDLGSSSSDYANAIAVQSDGTILVAGSSDANDFGDFAVVRYNANGTLDASFGASGKVLTDLNSGSWDQATTMAVQNDGKILVGGSSLMTGHRDFAVVRINANGSLDTSLNSNGKVLTDLGANFSEYINAMTVQSDGKILVAGYSDAAGTFDFAVVRYNANGSLDTSFNSTGKLLTDIGAGSYEEVYAMVQQSDGKILVAGSSDASGSEDFALVRYNTDGTLDTSFNSTGKVLTDLGGTTENPYAMTLQSDGKILLAGRTNASGSSDIALVRYNTDGSLDTSFNLTGKVLTDVGSGSTDDASAIAVQSDGKILVAGSSDASGSGDFAVVRYNADGSLDMSFNSTGKVLTDIGSGTGDSAMAIAVQSDGKILVGGASYDLGPNDFAIVRYNVNGTLDLSFGTNGKVLTDLGSSSSDSATAMALQNDGKILLAGYSDASGSSGFAVVRYNANGSPDTSFGSSGKVLTGFGSGLTGWINSIALQSDGKILVAGTQRDSAYYDFALVRYNSNGALDNSFNSNGILISDLGGGDDEAVSIGLQADGKILCAGMTTAGGTYDFALVRFNANGSR